MALSCSPDIFRNALDHIPDAVLISDCAGAVRFANRRAPQLLGYGIEELLGQDLEHLMPERFRRRHTEPTELTATAGRDRPARFDRPLAARRKDGSEFPAQISFDAIEDTQGTFIVATIRDLTAHRRLCADLSRAHDAAAHAEGAARQARDALAATRRANAAQWISACYLLRQQLQALSILNGLLARGGQPDEVTLTHALSDQVEAMVTLMNLLNSPDDPATLASHRTAGTTDTPDGTLTRLIESLRRNASLPQPIPASARIAPAPPVAQTNREVLIVLRDWGTREAAATFLRISGYDVLTSRNAEEARAIAGLHPEVRFVLAEQDLGGAQTGAEVVDSLRPMLGPDLKAVLIGDDPLIARVDGLDPADCTRVARMPIRAEELLRMMEELRKDGTPRPAKTPDSSGRHAR